MNPLHFVRRGILLLCLLGLGGITMAVAEAELPDISTLPADLVVPPATTGVPAPGRRVVQQLPSYRQTQVHHLLYLPTGWQPGRRYPVIVEYAGNGNFKNKYGDVSDGSVEGSKLGYGLSGGKGFIWVCMPYVNHAEGKNEPIWWGDVPATLDYCMAVVRLVCEQYGGDPAAVLLTGFSRGAIGCNYLGLHDDRIADIWLGFIPYSHYYGVRDWPWPGGKDKAAARERFLRLKGRASFVCQEGSTRATQAYLGESAQLSPMTFLDLPFRNHNDGWALRDSPARRQLRAWVADVLARRPGTLAIHGQVSDAAGQAVAGARVSSGPTHWTVSGQDGHYTLAGLVAGPRQVAASAPGLRFDAVQTSASLAAGDLHGINFRAAAGAAPGGTHP